MYFLSYGHLKARVSNYLNIILINKKLENIKTKLKKRIIEVGATWSVVVVVVLCISELYCIQLFLSKLMLS